MPVSSPLFGSPAQYQSARRPEIIEHRESITGATVNDPSGLNRRQPLLSDPEWASPLQWFTRPIKEYATSLAIYWFGYGILQILVILPLALLTGVFSKLSVGGLVFIFWLGPLSGLAADVLALVTGGWALAFGLICLLAEPVLFVLFYFSSEWRDRLKCGGILLAVVVIRALVLSFAARG